MRHITSVGLKIPDNNSDSKFIPLDSFGSLSESDIVIFSPNLSFTDYQYDSFNVAGRKCYNRKSSIEIEKHIEHWNSEIKSFLNSNRTLFVILEEVEWYVLKNSTGGGYSSNNYNFIPFQIGLKPSNGKVIIGLESEYKSLINVCEGYMTYNNSIDGVDSQIENVEEIFITQNKDKVLGVKGKFINGYIVFIPKIDFSLFSEYKPDIHLPQWTDSGIVKGKAFLKSLIQIDRNLHKINKDKTITPDWVQNAKFDIIKVNEEKKLVELKTEEVERLNLEIQKINDEIIEKESLKDLLFETGKPLENAVIKALKLLEYEAENFTNGVLELDQVITCPDGRRFIGECEGKDSNHIDINKLRQLSDSLKEDYERPEITDMAFGILFGNPQRLLPLEERNLDFTEKCKRAAEREKYALIKTSDLFFVAQYLIEVDNSSLKKDIRNSIFNQLGSGKAVIFPPIPLYK